jgi:hypothetical protein
MNFERWKIGYLQWCDFKQEKDFIKLFSCQTVWYVMEDTTKILIVLDGFKPSRTGEKPSEINSLKEI